MTLIKKRSNKKDFVISQILADLGRYSHSESWRSNLPDKRTMTTDADNKITSDILKDYFTDILRYVDPSYKD